ncbi:hypothetical protein EYF80_006460 [Liparis tanakae]|uniref:Uncharacterized protein n=1 Tax=Liparis tanakae TaxID=230148 RepID=A0A4Z2IZP5_9TELE|nr:hypothetical protein EYF80_006460 [Liparis tanakae]
MDITADKHCNHPVEGNIAGLRFVGVDVRGNVPAVSEGAAVRERLAERSGPSCGVKRNNVGALGGAQGGCIRAALLRLHNTLQLTLTALHYRGNKRKEKKACENWTKGGRRDSKPSAPLAILMSSAVRIKAMRVELKWTELSSATGRSIRSSRCGRANQVEW